MNLSEPSIQSLYIESRFNGQKIATATGFITFSNNKKPFLITNWHNVTGKNSLTGEYLSNTAAIPNEILIKHNKKDQLGEWIDKIEPILIDDEKPLWYEHPTLGNKVDIIALPLTELEDVDLYDYILENVDEEDKINISPSEIVSVVGFPFGKSVSGFYAIWATGFIATEPDLDYENLPIFLIDCRSRKGQSGSPVIVHRNGNVIMADNSVSMYNSSITQFLGVYSGRINKESDLGMVWKTSCIKELIDSIN